MVGDRRIFSVPADVSFTHLPAYFGPVLKTGKVERCFLIPVSLCVCLRKLGFFCLKKTKEKGWKFITARN